MNFGFPSKTEEPAIPWMRKLATLHSFIPWLIRYYNHEMSTLWHLNCEMKAVRVSHVIKVSRISNFVLESEENRLESLWKVCEFWSEKFVGIQICKVLVSCLCLVAASGHEIFFLFFSPAQIFREPKNAVQVEHVPNQYSSFIQVITFSVITTHRWHNLHIHHD